MDLLRITEYSICMGITFAEFLILLIIGWALYIALRPLRRRLEQKIATQLSGKRTTTVIDITPRKKQ